MKMKPKSAEYDPSKIESKWQKKWHSSKIYKSTEDGEKEKFYILDMFPYPSGEGLHVGHPKGYIATDIVARHYRMKGRSVLHPMGFDAFGLPAENYAIKTKTNPEIAVKKNIANYKRQLGMLGLDYDWSREVNTTDPKYYKWTQWIFLQLFKKGLAYESNEPVNWCPTDKTVLANEDVEDGKCERCGTVVEKKPMRQWVLKITDYAERLLNDLDSAELKWPESIKEAQRNWIGRSEGAEIDFRITLENRKIRFVLLHGFEGSAKTNFFPWLKTELENRGHEVETPELPDANHPKETDQVEYVLKNCQLDENTVVVAHSLGSVVAVKALMKLGKNISGLVLVAPAIDPSFPSDEDLEARPFWKEFTWGFDYDLIKKLTGGRIAVLSDTQEKLRMKYCRFLSGKLNANLVETKASLEHFCDKEEPEILKSVTPTVTVFTTRPDTLFGVTYLVLAPEHPWISGLLEHTDNRQEIEAYIESTKTKNTIDRTDAKKEKTGVELKGVVGVHPETSAELAIWIADYVLPDYGTGAVMAVPAHDERDRQFADKYHLPIKELPKTYNGGKKVVKYKLRDWVFSRQRYWGEPIPVIHCDSCGVVPVPEKDLPVKLPKVKYYEPTGTGESPLAAINKWVNIKCPQCKGKAKRETNTMPQWAGSSWYYLRYEDPTNKKQLVSPDKEKYWSPVDLYVGGAEHATRHLIYSRFWHKFLHDIGVVSTSEPFTRLQNVGLIMGEDGRKMSKRFGNVVNPDEVVKIYGADTLRIYEMFMGPFDQQISWSTSSMVGSRRFVERVWKLGIRVMEQEVGSTEAVVQSSDHDRIIHKAIKKVTEDIQNLRFNTAISALMIATNELEKAENISRADYEALLKLVAPFAPHATEELWIACGNKKSIHISSWPVYDPSLTVENQITMVVQINGKVRGSFTSLANSDEESVKKQALSLPEVEKWLKDQVIKKVIVVAGRLVNIVV